MFGEQRPHRNVVVVRAKSTGLAILLALLFGPLGLLYSSVTGAILMFIAYVGAVIAGVLTFGIGFLLLLFIHPICAVWAALAVSSYNKKLLEEDDELPRRAAASGSMLGLSLSPPAPVEPSAPSPAQQWSAQESLRPVIVCEECGGSLVAGKRFCKYCGHPTESATSATPTVTGSAPPVATTVSSAPLPDMPPELPVSAPVEMPPTARPPIEAVAYEAAPLPAANPIAHASSPLPEADMDAMQTTLFEAVRQGNLGSISSLLRANPDLVFSKDEEQWTPLHWAAGSGQRDIAELLLSSGADASAKALEDRTPLHFAAFKGHINVVELLLAYKANVNAMTKSGESPLYVAILGSHADMVELLRKRGGQE